MVTGTGADSVTGLNVRAQIGDGTGATDEPVFSEFNFTGGIWAAFANTVTGELAAGFEQFIQVSVVFNTAGQAVVPNGLIVTLVIDTTSISEGQYDLKFSETEIGADTVFIATGGIETPIDITNGRIIIAAENHAPVLDNTGEMTLTAIDEDDTTNDGDRVSDIIGSASGDRITDEDSGDPEGIAVIGVDNTHGIWQYSTDGGTIWLDFGLVSASSAVLLGTDVNDRIRFVPAPDFSGTIPSGVTFRAWDRSDGLSKGTTGIDVSVNGGSTAYSAATEVAGITVNPVNDDPVLFNNASLEADEGVQDALVGPPLRDSVGFISKKLSCESHWSKPIAPGLVGDSAFTGPKCHLPK